MLMLLDVCWMFQKATVFQQMSHNFAFHCGGQRLINKLQGEWCWKNTCWLSSTLLVKGASLLHYANSFRLLVRLQLMLILFLTLPTHLCTAQTIDVTEQMLKQYCICTLASRKWLQYNIDTKAN